RPGGPAHRGGGRLCWHHRLRGTRCSAPYSDADWPRPPLAIAVVRHRWCHSAGVCRPVGTHTHSSSGSADRTAHFPGGRTILLLAHSTQPPPRRRLGITVTTTTTTALPLDAVSYQVRPHCIIDDVSLDVHYGQVLALVGPNGAGKSSVLGLLAGDIKPTSGAAPLDHRPLATWDSRELAQTRAVLLQANQVAFSFTAQDVIDMGRAPWIGTPQADQDEDSIAES